MPSVIHYPRDFLKWQARVVSVREAHLYRASHDGRGNWTVTCPSRSERLYFPTDESPQLGEEGTGEGPDISASTSPAAKPGTVAMTHADQWEAAVRSSHPDFN